MMADCGGLEYPQILCVGGLLLLSTDNNRAVPRVDLLWLMRGNNLGAQGFVRFHSYRVRARSEVTSRLVSLEGEVGASSMKVYSRESLLGLRQQPWPSGASVVEQC